jgi:hypothetical protein
MNRGPTDEAVVAVKLGADEFMVTWMRVKHRENDRKSEAKGGTRKRSWPLIKDRRVEISLTGATDYLHRKQRTNQAREITDNPLQTRVK